MNYSKNLETSVIARHEAIPLIRLLHSFFFRNDVNKGLLLMSLVVGVLFSSFAQTSNKKRVLVIPAGQFQFVTEFDIQVIASLNEISASEVFVTYEKALLNSFETFGDKNFEFVPVRAEGFRPYKRMIQYEYGKFDKKHYNSVNLKNFSEADFTKLLESYDADFVVFITWYDIQKEGFTRKGKHLKRASYAGHYIDFAIYNLLLYLAVCPLRAVDALCLHGKLS